MGDLCSRGIACESVWDVSAADLALRPRGTSAWWFFDPVVGDALRAVGDRDRSTFAESEGSKRAPHRRVVLVCVAAQVIRALGRKAENCPRDPTPTHRGHAVNDVVVGIGMPRTIDLRVGLVWPGSERKDGEWSLVVGHKEAVFARDVFLSVNPTWVSVGPLSRIPVRLHKRAGVLVHALDELEVVTRSDSNLHAITLSEDHSLLTNIPTMRP